MFPCGHTRAPDNTVAQTALNPDGQCRACHGTRGRLVLEPRVWSTAPLPTSDFSLTQRGTTYYLEPHTVRAIEWIAERMGPFELAPHDKSKVIVSHHVAGNVTAAIQHAGLTIVLRGEERAT